MPFLEPACEGCRHQAVVYLDRCIRCVCIVTICTLPHLSSSTKYQRAAVNSARRRMRSLLAWREALSYGANHQSATPSSKHESLLSGSAYGTCVRAMAAPRLAPLRLAADVKDMIINQLHSQSPMSFLIWYSYRYKCSASPSRRCASAVKSR